MLRLFKLAEQISPHLFLVFVNDDRNPPVIPLLSMALDGTFVFDRRANALKYAFLKGYTQMMGARSQGAFTNRKLPRHLPVMFDFFVSPKQVRVAAQRPLFGRQKSQAF